jgi:hypothetical protein
MPNRPSPTTLTPMTVPPEKAICSASFSPVDAACVVRVLDWVAIRMPMNPATPLQRAPTTKDKATIRRGPWLKKASRTVTTTTKIESTWYSRRRKAMAPSRMADPIS